MSIDPTTVRNRIFSIINTMGLRDGDPLPSTEMLAIAWHCDADAAAATLEQALQQDLVEHRKDGSHTVAIPVHHEDELSFAQSAAREKQVVATHVIRGELEKRPPWTAEDYPFRSVEETARKKLGLAPGESFLVIPRIRTLKGVPRVVHRAYLSPARFSPNFLEEHDFAHSSLIRIYEECGYVLTSRETTLTARYANLLELGDFGTPERGPTPVLVAEQQLFAIDPSTNKPFTLEYLVATYLNWQYRIENRIPPRNERRI